MDELEQLEAELAAARAERDARQSKLEREAKIAVLKQQLADEPHIAAAVEEHGAIGVEIGVLHTPSGAIVVRRPRQAQWRRMHDAQSKGLKAADIDTLVRGCLIYPSKADLDRILDAHPGALDRAGMLALQLSGVSDEEAEGK